MGILPDLLPSLKLSEVVRAKFTNEEKMANPRKNIPVTHGNKDEIILPEGMSTDQAIEWLTRSVAENERNVAVAYSIPCFPLDGAVAFYRAVQSKFGWTGQIPTPGMFGPKEPMIINVDISPTEHMQVPWGGMGLSGIDGYLSTDFKFVDGTPMFMLTGKVRQKHKKDVDEIFAATKKFLREESIYRGKAIKVEFEGEDFDPRNYDPTIGPKFIDTSVVNPKSLILSDENMDSVQTGLFTPIDHYKECKKYGIPTKRGILLAGPYGVGKTLLASVTAKVCEANKFTYIYLKDARQLAQGIFFAQQYSPAVLFVEDIDTVVGGNARTDEVNDVLNTIDGIDNKESEVIVVFTTNHLERITPAMMRPGRVDTLIALEPPNQKAVAALLKGYGGEYLDTTDEQLQEVALSLAGRIPAFIREVAERSKLFGIKRLKKGQSLKITSEDLTRSVKAMEVLHKSMGKGATESLSPLELFGKEIGKEIAKALLSLKLGEKAEFGSDYGNNGHVPVVEIPLS